MEAEHVDAAGADATLFPELAGRSTAVLSPDGRYRYRLDRTWDPARVHAVFVMLNPSTADADEDDPTIRRCIGFARRFDCGGITVVNLFGYRSTDPARLLLAPDPVGPDNATIVDGVLAAAATQHVFAAWGAAADLPSVATMASRFTAKAADAGIQLLCLGTTYAGHPRHPLYVPADVEVLPWPR